MAAQQPNGGVLSDATYDVAFRSTLTETRDFVRYMAGNLDVMAGNLDLAEQPLAADVHAQVAQMRGYLDALDEIGWPDDREVNSGS